MVSIFRICRVVSANDGREIMLAPIDMEKNCYTVKNARDLARGIADGGPIHIIEERRS